MRTIIIDGYNLLFRYERLKKLVDGGLIEKAREGLIRMVQGYASGKKVDMWLVFDGRSGFGTGSDRQGGALHVVFTDGPADASIVALARRFKDAGSDLEVVSSDRRHITRDLGARTNVISSEEFVKRIHGSQKAPRAGRGERGEKPEPPRGISVEEYYRGVEQIKKLDREE